MKNSSLCLICFIGILLFSSCNKSTPDIERIAIGGDSTVLIIDKNQSEGNNLKVLWKWEKAELNGKIPPESAYRFRNVDECKFVDNNTKMLITCGAGGVGLIDIETKEILFYSYCPLAHSADLLPNNRIAVALSIHDQGNSIQLYDIDKPDVVLFRDSLYSGHGSVWMDNLNKYYALGYDELREYTLQKWNSDSPSLKLERQWTIPTPNGHDLSAVSDNKLLVSSVSSSYLFNISDGTFEEFAPLANVPHIKSVVYDKEKNSIIYTKAEEEWWTYNVYFTNPDKVINISDLKIYKARSHSLVKGATLKK